jgi:hypothetical protein
LSAFLGGIVTADRIDTPFISGRIDLTRRTVCSGAKRASVSARRTPECGFARLLAELRSKRRGPHPECGGPFNNPAAVIARPTKPVTDKLTAGAALGRIIGAHRCNAPDQVGVAARQ